MHLDKLKQLEDETFEFLVAEAKVVMNRRRYDRGKPLRTADFALVKCVRKAVIDRIKKAEQDSKSAKDSGASPQKHGVSKPSAGQPVEQAAAQSEPISETDATKLGVEIMTLIASGMSPADAMKKLKSDRYPVADAFLASSPASAAFDVGDAAQPNAAAA
ncbi:MAG: hypothetical protein L6Q71_06090 [Planctomycetes bacterium]|nr:hypothetical protein [Planctomycetota bacterium]NUQ36082.1 hypothetical protein [Planctomycetaceae bacterium]